MTNISSAFIALTQVIEAVLILSGDLNVELLLHHDGIGFA